MFFNLFKKQPPQGGDKQPGDAAPAPSGDAISADPAPTPGPASEGVRRPSVGQRHPGIPSTIFLGMDVKIAPERQSGTPRLWDSTILKLDHEGIWLAQDKGPDALPVKVGDSVVVLVLQHGSRMTYDCSVLRINHTVGNTAANEVLVAPPAQQSSEYSAVAGRGNRKHLRIDVALPGECREVNRDDSLGPALTIHTLNVSLSGLAFRSTRTFDVGREVEVRLLAWKFPLHVRAHVVRTVRQADGSFMIAIAFPAELSSITRELISQFILENQRR